MFDPARIRQHLRDFAFAKLFIQELGWDHHTSHLEASVDGKNFELTAIAQKRGLVVFNCALSVDGSSPDYPTRRKIERQVAKSVHEHLIIYTDGDKTTQVWQWVKREAGKPAACREHTYHRHQAGDALMQKLQGLVFSLEEEERLTIVDVTRRARAAFDVERVTKRFYDRFKTEHSAFLKFIKGIPDEELHRWYASVMLNRLMFIYFIQKKGFLDNDHNYLRNRLRQSQEHGKDQFYTDFLCRLFFEGFAKKESERSQATQKLLGKVPYLNGGIFLRHQIEELHGRSIHIADAAFEKLFDFFEQYQWHLDERPLRNDKEINPDVLGYIFEKYINQKQMGAYYTKEDITGYISQNTVIPFLFDAARQKCKIAFEGEQSIWRLLQTDPDRYIYDAVKKGVNLPLPVQIAAGLDDVSRRTEWNKPARPEHALPTEIWREVVARRKRYDEVRAKLVNGEIRDINDLITYNLNIRQFAQDVVENCEGPELLRAFWHAIDKITVLDPTVGSGAFLFACLNILEPVYQACCLDRMEVFLAELERSGEKHRPEKFGDFRKILERIEQHPNQRYFILKSIIINNLYGVDIMEEAVEICKLRLFLKLVAQVERVENIEPLPDIDFNIRAGNTLVGYATYDDVKRAVTSKLDFEGAMERIEEKAQDVDRLFRLFRQQQTELRGEVTPQDKQELRNRLMTLENELNRYLANDYGVDVKKKPAYEGWLSSHKPFHWFIEFYGIVSSGGFDVIIGNPPYVVNTPEKVPYNIQEGSFTTHSCKNLYAFVYERSLQLAHRNSSLGLIVQLTALSSEKMAPLQDLLIRRGLLVAPSFPRRPESIFDGVEMPVTILISRAQCLGVFTSRISRFYTEERPQAINAMLFQKHGIRVHGHRVGKLGLPSEIKILQKLDVGRKNLDSLTTASSKDVLYYQEACRYWAKACKGYPFFRRNGNRMTPPHGRVIYFNSPQACAFAACLVNSTLFYWYYSALSDCEHINDALIRTFKIPDSWDNDDWLSYEACLAGSLKENADRKTITTKQGHKIEYDELDASKSKSAIDEIDQVLARHYGFTEEELDFIINYDIKYRMGREEETEELND